MLKFHKISPFAKFEKVLDFSREVDIAHFQGYYMKNNEINSNRNIPLYVMEPEEVTKIYYCTVSASDWIRENLEYNNQEKTTILPEEFMYKFDLIRVIPEGGIPTIDSFLRVHLKMAPDNAKLYSIEEELHSKNWKAGK
jgi:hypothetical protein